MTVTHCTFYSNTSGLDAESFQYDNFSGSGGVVTLQNNIFDGHVSGGDSGLEVGIFWR